MWFSLRHESSVEHYESGRLIIEKKLGQHKNLSKVHSKACKTLANNKGPGKIYQQ